MPVFVGDLLGGGTSAVSVPDSGTGWPVSVLLLHLSLVTEASLVFQSSCFLFPCPVIQVTSFSSPSNLFCEYLIHTTLIYIK